ncbi:site-specific integrase [Acidithiobacillus sp. CV18-2]|nr:site-specific integrase [Acidithiobacillus sp. CV18-3]MBU2758329.1 site-specific integrase [Acidithiobacillus sp. BN09-2]MBU2775952.1 site-specific integrase [Acidithiobacillus sp. CV18-2]MBU2798840.1 site-specific integrase [Acidithiobacillus sp. VAN18-4]
MATINPRSDRDGNVIGWQAIVRKRGFPSQTKTFRTKRDAERWAREAETDMERGVFVSRKEAENTTLAEALDRYSKEVSALKKGAVQEISIIGKVKESPLSHMYLGTIQGKDIAKYRDAMLADGYSPITIKRRLSIISHLFSIADKEWGMDGLGNPVQRVSVQKPNNARNRRLVGNEEERLLASAQEYGGPLASIIQFAIETAMRRGEIAAMLWRDVDMRACVLLVPDSKTGDPRRVPLSSRAHAILDAMPRRLDGKVWGMRADSVTQAFDRACKRAEINDLRFHDLRHEATSRLFEKGLNPMQVASITGHKTLQMLKRYTHLRAEDLARLLG